jgi:hypothetical protein
MMVLLNALSLETLKIRDRKCAPEQPKHRNLVHKIFVWKVRDRTLSTPLALSKTAKNQLSNDQAVNIKINLQITFSSRCLGYDIDQLVLNQSERFVATLLLQGNCR